MTQAQMVRSIEDEVRTAGLSPNFCQNWPVAKSVLQAIENATKNPFVKLAIQILIQVGDTLCPAAGKR